MQRLAIGLAVLAAAGAAAAAAAPAASPDLRIANAVALTQDDGKPIPVKQTIRVFCGPWDSDVRKPSIHVQAGSRAGLWQLSAVVADVRRNRVVRFPHSFVFNKPTKAQLFAADGRNEASSAEEEASGRITFTKVQCGKHLDIRFKVDAVLGSELSDLTPITVSGTFSARG